MKFSDIPQMTRDANYRVNQPWTTIENWLAQMSDRGDGKISAIDLDPDFQRAHVWTESQQRAYVEFCLKGGKGSNELRFNCAGWMDDYRGPFVIVDGKQRLEAVRKFLRNELAVFDTYYNQFEDKLNFFHADFIVMINDLPTYPEVLQWYLDINTGGTPHTDLEIEKVKHMLDVHRWMEKRPKKTEKK